MIMQMYKLFSCLFFLQMAVVLPVFAGNEVNQVPKFCMHCKGIKTTLTPEGTPYACKYCNGTGILKSSESNIIK